MTPRELSLREQKQNPERNFQYVIDELSVFKHVQRQVDSIYLIFKEKKYFANKGLAYL